MNNIEDFLKEVRRRLKAEDLRVQAMLNNELKYLDDAVITMSEYTNVTEHVSTLIARRRGITFCLETLTDVEGE